MKQTASGCREKGRDREAREKGHGHAAQQDDMRTERSSCPCAPRAPCAAPPDACPMPSDAWLLQRGALTHQVLICTSTTESSAQSDSRSAHVPCMPMPMSTSHADGPNGTTLRASSIRSSSRRGRSSSTHGRCSERIAPCGCSLCRTRRILCSRVPWTTMLARPSVRALHGSARVPLRYTARIRLSQQVN